MKPPIPLVILGGSDTAPGPRPASPETSGEATGPRPLTGCKGVDVRINGRCLADLLIERLRGLGAFDPICVAGPAAAYRVLEQPVTLIDTDAGFGKNIEAGITWVQEEFGSRPMAIATCDIVPDAAELEAVWQDWLDSQPTDLWFPIIEAPHDRDELGASAWKPRYRVLPEDGGELVPVLPSHLTVFDPAGLRLGFLYKLMDVAYRTRNRSITYRRATLFRELAWNIFLDDLRKLATFQVPGLFLDIVVSGSRAAGQLRDQTITRAGLENALRRMFVTRAHRKAYPDRRIRLPILPGLSLARDIDTHEEAEALRQVAVAGASS